MSHELLVEFERENDLLVLMEHEHEMEGKHTETEIVTQQNTVIVLRERLFAASPPAGPDRQTDIDRANEAVDRLAALGYDDGEALIRRLQAEARKLYDGRRDDEADS